MSEENPPNVRIETARLVLRPHALSDAPALTALANNWNVVQHLRPLPFPYELHDAEDFLSNVSTQHPVTTFAVCTKTNGENLIGVVGFTLPDETVVKSFGYWLGEPYWGCGYATEAALAVLLYAREHLDAREIHASYRPENPGSARVLAKCGFSVCGKGQMESAALKRTVDIDLVVQTEEAWNSLRPKLPAVTIIADDSCTTHQTV